MWGRFAAIGHVMVSDNIMEAMLLLIGGREEGRENEGKKGKNGCIDLMMMYE